MSEDGRYIEVYGRLYDGITCEKIANLVTTDSLVVGQFEKNSVLQGFGVEFPRVRNFVVVQFGLRAGPVAWEILRSA
jgi:hypothetical protein